MSWRNRRKTADQCNTGRNAKGILCKNSHA
jgi:hypothetical protein